MTSLITDEIRACIGRSESLGRVEVSRREIVKYAIASGLIGLGEFNALPKGNAQIAAIGKLQATASSFILLNKYGSALMSELDAGVEKAKEQIQVSKSNSRNR